MNSFPSPVAGLKYIVNYTLIRYSYNLEIFRQPNSAQDKSSLLSAILITYLRILSDVEVRY